MAFAERAYHQYTNPNTGTVDRVEIHQEGYSGSVTQLKGQTPYAIDFEHRETTGTQREYLSIFENQIVMGVLDLSVWVTSTAIQTLINDIADATTKNFKAIWKRDGSTVWQGYKHGRIVDYPEKDPNTTPYIAKIQFRDFEILKGLDYPIDPELQERQKIISTFSEIFNQLGFSESIKTHTSWQCEGTTVSDDFLNQVYHDTYALRQYANDEDGYSADQNISYYDALLRTADPMLVLYQWKGFNIFQISDCKTQPMKYAVYNSSGTQVTSTTVDRSYTLSNSSSNQPSVKSTTNNTSYPALKRAIYEFQHRSGSSQVEFPIKEDSGYLTPNEVDFDGAEYLTIEKPFSGSGDETIVFGGNFISYQNSNDALASIAVADKFLDSNYEWIDNTNFLTEGIFTTDNLIFNDTGVNTSNGTITRASGADFENGIPVRIYTEDTIPTGLEIGKTYFIINYSSGGTTTFQLSETRGGSAIVPSDTGMGAFYLFDIRSSFSTESRPSFTTYYVAEIEFETDFIPDSAEGDIEIILFIKPATLQSADSWYSMDAFIKDPTIAGESIEFRLIQDNDYPESLRLPDSYYGDGPYAYSRSSYRTSTTLADITTGWRRRGDTTYIPYSRLKLNEVLDYQRVRQLKKTFEINGDIEPDMVAVYESDPFMYVGGRYNGRWRLIGVKVEENTDA